MKRLQYALVAGSTLMALAVTGCSSSTSKPAAQQPAASGSSAGASGTTPTASTSESGAPSSASGATGAPSSSSAVPSASGKNSSSASKPASKTSSAPAGTPGDCDNAKLDASLAPASAGQKASVHVIAVKNTGAACSLQYLPYVWITAGPSGGPEQTRPLIPSGLGGGPNIIKNGETQYAAIDLNPGDASNAVPGYTFLSVTANPTPDTSGKDVQDLKLPAPAKVAKAKLGLYMPKPADAISSAEGADTPEQ